MERKIYTTPRTKLFSVELEGTFAGSVVQENPQSGVTTSGHEVNNIDFSGESWNDGAWTE
ncbi:MAG: hypothetical protein J6A66_07865 [Alistipes sp.]|nr:hypothetical protein [Alistipes sp.]